MNLGYLGVFAVLLIIPFVIPADAVSPNQQIKNGILPLDIICGNNDHTLLIRPSGDGTVCASENSAKRLVNFGWIKVDDLLGDDDDGTNYFISVNDLTNSIYLFEEKTVTISGILYRNNVVIPLVECNNNPTNSKTLTIISGYKPDKNSSYFISDVMGNVVGVKVPFVKNNPVAIGIDDLGDTITGTGIIKPVQFTPNWCDSMTLQQSAYLEVFSIDRNN